METKFKETTIGLIPEEWGVTHLEDFCERITKGTTPTSVGFGYQDTGINFIKVESIDSNGNFLPYLFAHISNETHNALERSIIKEDDLLFSIAGALGRVALANKNILPANTNQALGIIRLKQSSAVDVKYLYFYLKGPQIQKHIQRINVQSAQANLTLAHLNKFQMLLPPLLEQHKIAEILSTVDEVVEKTDSIIQETQQLKKGLMQKLFTEGIGHTRFKETKIGRIPEEWKVVRFDQCLQKTGQKDPIKKPDEKFAYIDVSAVSNEFFKIVESKTILGKDAPSRARKGIKTGDTIYATVRPYLRRVAFVPSELDGEICSTGYCVLRPKSEEISHRFIFQLMLTHRVNGYLESLQVGTSYPAISDSDVYQMLIPKPPLLEQRRIVEILSEVDGRIETERVFRLELEKLKKGLMQVLLTGQVRVKV